MKKRKALSWFLSVIMALTVFSIPTMGFAKTTADDPGDTGYNRAIVYDNNGVLTPAENLTAYLSDEDAQDVTYYYGYKEKTSSTWLADTAGTMTSNDDTIVAVESVGEGGYTLNFKKAGEVTLRALDANSGNECTITVTVNPDVYTFSIEGNDPIANAGTYKASLSDGSVDVTLNINGKPYAKDDLEWRVVGGDSVSIAEGETSGNKASFSFLDIGKSTIHVYKEGVEAPIVGLYINVNTDYSIVVNGETLNDGDTYTAGLIEGCDKFNFKTDGKTYEGTEKLLWKSGDVTYATVTKEKTASATVEYNKVTPAGGVPIMVYQKDSIAAGDELITINLVITDTYAIASEKEYDYNTDINNVKVSCGENDTLTLMIGGINGREYNKNDLDWEAVPGGSVQFADPEDAQVTAKYLKAGEDAIQVSNKDGHIASLDRKITVYDYDLKGDGEIISKTDDDISMDVGGKIDDLTLWSGEKKILAAPDYQKVKSTEDFYYVEFENISEDKNIVELKKSGNGDDSNGYTYSLTANKEGTAKIKATVSFYDYNETTPSESTRSVVFSKTYKFVVADNYVWKDGGKYTIYGDYAVLTDINLNNESDDIWNGVILDSVAVNSKNYPVTAVDESIFDGYEGDLTIGANIDSIDPNSYANSFTAFYTDENNKNYNAVDGVLFSKDGSELIAYPNGSDDDEYEIPENVNSINLDAFRNDSLEVIKIPAGLDDITADMDPADTAFAYYCKNGKWSVAFDIDPANATYTAWAKKYNVKLVDIDINNCNIEFVGGGVETYTGDMIEPALNITYNGEDLECDVDYEVTYENNINANDSNCKATIEGKGAYSGSVQKSFTIKPAEMSKVKVDFEENARIPYDGKAHTPSATLTYNGKTLEKGTDYSVITMTGHDYSAVGTHELGYAGTGNFTGDTKGSFEIYRSLKTCTVSFEKNPYSVIYTGNDQKPTVKVTDPDGAVVAATEYTVEYPADTASAGTKTVTVKGNGTTMEDSNTADYSIVQADLSKATVTLEKTAYIYDGTDKKPAVTVKNVAGETINPASYTVTYPTDIKNVGKKTVTITPTTAAKANFIGTAPAATYEIYEEGDIEAATINLDEDVFVYDGEVQYADVTSVEDPDGKALVEGTDYTVSYENDNSVKVGEYAITVKGIGKWKSSQETSYKINPQETYIKSLKKGKKRFTVKWKKKTVQVTGYKIRYARNSDFENATTKTVKDTKTVKKTIKGLKANKRYYVQVRTYKKTDDGTFYSEWCDYSSVKTRK